MKRLLPLVLLLACACGTQSGRPRVEQAPAGPDHLLALRASDLGSGWTTGEEPDGKTCLQTYGGTLGGTVETVTLQHGAQTVVQEIRTLPTSRTPDYQRLEVLRSSCPFGTGEEPRIPGVREARYGQDPVLRRDGDTASVWQPTDTGVVVLTVTGLAVEKAYSAFQGRRSDWMHDRTATALALWKDKGPRSYTMTYDRGCFCDSGAFQVTVVDGTVTRSVSPRGEDQPTRMQTVDGLFAELQGLDQPTYAATFDPELGFPTHVAVDRIIEAIDDEFGATISALSPTR
jgi:hypothetical protein